MDLHHDFYDRTRHGDSAKGNKSEGDADKYELSCQGVHNFYAFLIQSQRLGIFIYSKYLLKCIT